MSNTHRIRYRKIDGKPRRFVEYIRELFDFREIAYVLIQRDLIVRFRQTYFGVAWLLFKPLMLMVSMTFAFGTLAGFEKDQLTPYPLIIFCGVIPWYFFSNAIPDSMSTLHWHINILQKTYFPRALFPVAAIASDCLEFLVAWILFFLACIWYSFIPGWQAIFFPLFAMQLLILCIGLGLLLSVINVRFRDIANLVPFLLTLGFLLSPVGYTLKRIPAEFTIAFSVNPLVGIIEGIRWSLLGSNEGFPLHAVLTSLAVTVAICIIGVRRFLADEPDIVDLA